MAEKQGTFGAGAFWMSLWEQGRCNGIPARMVWDLIMKKDRSKPDWKVLYKTTSLISSKISVL